MKSKVVVFVVSAIVAGTVSAAASTRAVYRIELRDGSEVLARDLPRPRGSVVLFHLNSSGALTSLPEEQVLRVRTGVADKSALYRSANRNAVDSMVVVTKKGLQPGDVVFLGPTGGGSPSTSSTTPVGTAATLPGGIYDPRNPAYGGYSAPRNGAPAVGVSADAFPSVEPPTAENPIGSNGFPTTPTAISPPGATGSTPLTIGPNGTPVMSPAGAPGAVPPPIGPNGTPVLAQPGTPGAASPPVGSNGYPAPRGPGR